MGLIALAVAALTTCSSAFLAAERKTQWTPVIIISEVIYFEGYKLVQVMVFPSDPSLILTHHLQNGENLVMRREAAPAGKDLFDCLELMEPSPDGLVGK